MAARGRVLLTDGEERSVLAAARGLAAAGYVVGVAAGDAGALALRSRAVAARHVVPGAADDPDGFVAALARVAEADAYDAAIACTDLTLELVSERRDAFPDGLRLGLPPHDSVLRTLDKVALCAAAARAGLPGPAAVRCADPGAAAAAARELGYPVIVKSPSSFVRDARTARQHTGAVAADEPSLRAAVAQLGGESLVQRFGPARLLAYSGVRTGGRTLALAVTRSLRTWPPDAGSSSLSVTAPADPELRRQVESIVDELGWEGLFQLQSVDDGAGRPAPIDLNPRPFGSLAQVIAAGANLPALWVDHLLGAAPAATVLARPGVHYRWEHGELGNLLDAVSSRRWRSAATVLRPTRNTVHAVLSLRDPAPAAGALVRRARSLLQA
jgi:predicted ATP-grasp superfamily ATP-dependent carboligase